MGMVRVYFFHFCAYYWFFSSGIQKDRYYLPEGLICEPLIGVSTLWMDRDFVDYFLLCISRKENLLEIRCLLISHFFSMFMLIFHIL